MKIISYSPTVFFFLTKKITLHFLPFVHIPNIPISFDTVAMTPSRLCFFRSSDQNRAPLFPIFFSKEFYLNY